MLFCTKGNPANPVVLMIHALFMDDKMFDNITSVLSEDYFVVLPILSGHSLTVKSTFYSAQKEAESIIRYLLDNKIFVVDILLGSSLGGIITFEIFRQNRIHIRNAFFDGTPFIRFSHFTIKIMATAFKYIAHCSARNPNKRNMLDRMFPHNAPQMRLICSSISDESINNLAKTCYTYSLPEAINLEDDQQCTFVYGTAEKSKMSIPNIKAYSNCKLIIKRGYKHCEFLFSEPEAYVEMLTQYANH